MQQTAEGLKKNGACRKDALESCRARNDGQSPTKLWVCLVTNFFETRDLIGLGTFRSLNDVELNLVALFEALVPLALNGTVMYEDVCPALSAEEAVTFCVVEPLYGAFILCQWSHSLVSCLNLASREVKVLQR